MASMAEHQALWARAADPAGMPVGVWPASSRLDRGHAAVLTSTQVAGWDGAWFPPAHTTAGHDVQSSDQDVGVLGKRVVAGPPPTGGRAAWGPGAGSADDDTKAENQASNRPPPVDPEAT